MFVKTAGERRLRTACLGRRPGEAVAEEGSFPGFHTRGEARIMDICRAGYTFSGQPLSAAILQKLHKRILREK